MKKQTPKNKLIRREAELKQAGAVPNWNEIWKDARQFWDKEFENDKPEEGFEPMERISDEGISEMIEEDKLEYEYLGILNMLERGWTDDKFWIVPTEKAGE
jgi:hypothetical protein